MQNYRIFFKYANILNEILSQLAFLFLFIGRSTLIVSMSELSLPDSSFLLSAFPYLIIYKKPDFRIPQGRETLRMKAHTTCRTDGSGRGRDAGKVLNFSDKKCEKVVRECHRSEIKIRRTRTREI